MAEFLLELFSEEIPARMQARAAEDLKSLVTDALKAATVNAAEALGRNSIGVIEAGKDADIIAVAGSPLDDVTRMESVDFVMRHGVIHKADGQRQAFPES